MDMRTARNTALAATILALTACGNNGGTQYQDAKSVAAAFDCTGFKTQDPELYAADAGSCTYAGHYTGIQWFKDTDARTGWANAPDFGTINLVGANWAIECDTKPDCDAIQKTLGGKVE